MHRFTLAIGVLAASLAAGTAEAQDAHVALFKNVSGTVKVVRENGSVDAAAGMTLFVSDRIISGPGSAAGITFKDGTLVTVGASTEIAVRDYAFETKDSRYAFSMYLAKGTAVYSSGKIGKLAPEAVKVDTPTATVGVRGTRFIVEAE